MLPPPTTSPNLRIADIETTPDPLIHLLRRCFKANSFNTSIDVHERLRLRSDLEAAIRRREAQLRSLPKSLDEPEPKEGETHADARGDAGDSPQARTVATAAVRVGGGTT